MSTFIYIQTHDTGLAPCVSEGIWSLALCKPTIRRRAIKGDIVIAVTPSKDGHRLSSWAKIKHQIPTDEYAKQYSKRRPDNIYEKLSGRYSRRSGVRHEMHNSKSDMEHDLGRNGKSAFVLVAKDFFTFGDQALKTEEWLDGLPQLSKEIQKLGRSFRRNHSDGVDKELKQLERLLGKKDFSKFHNKGFKPRDPGLNPPCETKAAERKYTCLGRRKPGE